MTSIFEVPRHPKFAFSVSFRWIRSTGCKWRRFELSLLPSQLKGSLKSIDVPAEVGLKGQDLVQTLWCPCHIPQNKPQLRDSTRQTDATSTSPWVTPIMIKSNLIAFVNVNRKFDRRTTLWCQKIAFELKKKEEAQNENKGTPGGHSVTQRLIVPYGMGHNYSLIKYHLSKYGSLERRGNWSNLHARVYKCWVGLVFWIYAYIRRFFIGCSGKCIL